MVSAVALLVLGTGCSNATAQGARASWLQDQLVADNRRWLFDRATLVEHKLAKMASHPYFFMRGTATVFYNDITRRGRQRATTAFVNSADAAEVMVVGDGHPENFGTSFRPGDDGPSLNFVDLDGAGFGPYQTDVRRAVLGLSMITTRLEGCERCVEDTARAAGLAYASHIAGETVLDPWETAVVDDLVDEATEEGEERKKLGQETSKDDDGLRSLHRDEVLDDEGEGKLELSASERSQVDRLMARFAQTDQAPEGFRVLDAVRRYGAGVASVPAVRYAVLYDTGLVDDTDDALLNVREVIDPPTIAGFEPLGLFDGNAGRIDATTSMWEPSDADPRYTALVDGNQTFKVTTWSSWFQELDHEKIAEEWYDEDYDPEDVHEIGAVLGIGLAQAHLRGRCASGVAAGPVIAADIAQGGGAEVFADEIAALAVDDLATTVEDYGTFLALLEEYGVLLGAETMVGGLP